MKKQKTASTGEQKQKLILFPFWHVERAERILAEQERNGYRFVKARFGCLFTFQKSTPREAKYVVSYHLLKDYLPHVGEWEDTLKSDDYRADVVHEGFNYHIFRITMGNVDLRDYYKARLWYVRKVLIQKTLVTIAATLLLAFVIPIGNIFFLLCTAGGFLTLVSYRIGFRVTARKRKALAKDWS